MPQGGEECLCYGCNNVFPKDQYGLTCPRCGSEFVEIIEGSDEEPPADQSPSSFSNPPESLQHPPSPHRDSQSPASQLFNHNPWAETEDDGVPPVNNGRGNGPTFSRHSYRSPDGRITFTTTFATGLPGRQRRVGSPDPFAGNDPLMQSFNAIFQGLVGGAYNNRTQDPVQAAEPDIYANGRRDIHGGLWPRDADGPQPMRHPIGSMNDIIDILNTEFPYDDHERPPGHRPRGGVHVITPGMNPLAIIASILGGGRHGDAVYSQEELDRVVSELIDQNINGNGAPPAAQSAIEALTKKKVDQEMLGPEGKAECSICMDPVELGTEVTVLPCKHWFHHQCIEMWLNQHNTCPHCRRSINASEQGNTQSTQNPYGARDNPVVISSSPTQASSPRSPVRRRPSATEQLHYQHSGSPYRHTHHRHHSSSGPSPRSRRSSAAYQARASAPPETQESQSSQSESSGGGITGWVRSHFGGS